MDKGIIKNLENNVSRAIDMIANLKKEKSILEKENESLRRRIGEFAGQLAEQKNALAAHDKALRQARPDSELQEVKDRLKKLVGKLAALEDSWT
jgi:FtsZ-binding cell division protein ZapB